MRYIPITVVDEYVQGGGVTAGAAGSHNDVALVISFSDMWDGTTKTIVWHDANGENPVFTLLADTMLNSDGAYIVPIPAEPKAIEGKMSMTIKGAVLDTADTAKESYATMTATAYFNILDSAWDADAETAADVNATMAEQLQTAIENATTATRKYIDEGLAEKETAGAAADAVSAHNSDTSAHSDIRNAIPKNTSQLKNDSGFITTKDIPEGAAASTTEPKMNGTADTGSENAFARGDHIHPTDTSRASASDLTSHTGNSNIHITASERTTWNAKTAKTTTTATLSASGWSTTTDGVYKTVTVSGVTSSNTVIVAPDKATRSIWQKANIYVGAQGTNTLTFYAKSVPTDSVVANILILN